MYVEEGVRVAVGHDVIQKKSVRRKRTDSYVDEPAAPFFHYMPAAEQLNACRTRDAPLLCCAYSTAPLSSISLDLSAAIGSPPSLRS